MRKIWLAAVSFFSFTAMGMAQTVTPNIVTPETMTGIQPFTTYDGVRENIALTNGNLNLNLPLLKLPQRAGGTWEIGLEYDSKVYQVHIYPAGQNQLLAIWQADRRFPMMAPNLRLSIPTLQSTWGVAPVGSGGSCATAFVLTTSDGGKHTFQNQENCQGLAGPIHVSDSDDASYIRLDTTNFTDIVAYLKNGTQIHFYGGQQGVGALYNGAFGKIIDPNGNIISSTGTGLNPDHTSFGLYTFTDSVGRIITADLNAQTIAYKDANGTSQTITFTNQNVSTGGPITFAHPASGECFVPNNPGTLVRSSSQNIGTTDVEWTMTIPDGASGLTYRFHYNAAGEMTKITYPSGGYTKYDFSPSEIVWNLNTLYCTAMDFREVVAKHECRSSSGSCGTEATTTYTPTISTDPNLAMSNLYMDVRSPDPSGTPNRTRDTFSIESYPWFASRELTRSVYSGESTLLRTIQTDYGPNCLYGGLCGSSIPIRVTTTLNDVSPNLVSKVETDYDTVPLVHQSGVTTIDNSTEVREFGYDGTVKRRTDNTWLKTGTYVIAQEHILNRPLSSVVYDSSGNTCQGQSNPCAQTTYEYDNYTQGLSSSGATQHQSMTTYRGNLTAISRWLNPGGTWLTTRFQYDDGGNVTQATDPRGNFTSYNFTDNFAQTSCTPASNGLTGNAAAYVKTISNALSQVTTYSYNSCFGNLATVTDPNLQVMSYAYDTLGRKSSISLPDGGLTAWSYNDVAPISITLSRKQTSIANVTSTEVHDGLGRVVQSKLTSDTAGTDYVDITYDVAGRKATVSNPYRSTSDPTYGITSYQYDALNRVATLTRQDGATVLTTYAGAATQVQDEGNGAARVARVSQADAQGRLTSICEVSSVTLLGSGATPAACGLNIAATGFLTTYQYDVLNNVTSVAQSGLNGRTFLYDSLSRLTSAANPESGTTTYAYDSNGNLTSKTDARAITVNYNPSGSPIDALNRVTQKTYSDGTPTATFTYDVSSVDGLTGLQKTVGRLVEASVGTARTVNSYDPLGRVLTQWQCTPQNCGAGWFSLAYQYDYLGNPTSSTNGEGVTLTYAYNGAAQLTGVTSSLSDANHPAGLFTSGAYNAIGALTGASLGNGIGLARSYDPRTRLTSLSDGTAYTVGLTYAPNSDVLTGNDSVNSNWTYGYDDFNRLKSASATGQSYTYDYDRFGNRWHQNGPYTMMESFSGSNNRMDGYSYDAAGNLLNDGTHNYAYDGENRIKQVDAGSTATYIYDAGGRRVRKTTATSVDFLYDLAGHEITEVSSSGVWNRGEVYAGARHVATYASGTTYFIHGDHLATERKRTSVSGGSIETCTSLAFGDHLNCTGSDVSPMHFTGKEHDSESNLENFGARHDSATLGRFMSPDPIGTMKQKFTDPQQWNMYSYTRNNPLRFVDPTGKYNTDCKEKDISKCTAEIQALDANIRANLQSKDKDVQKAAAAYGSFNDGNKVNVLFDPNASDAGTAKQDIKDNKPQDSITVTFRSMKEGGAGQGLVAHEGSHVVDFDEVMKGGKSPTLYAGESKAYGVQAATLLDQPKGSRLAVANGEFVLNAPDSAANRAANLTEIDKYLLKEYTLDPANPGGAMYVQPQP